MRYVLATFSFLAGLACLAALMLGYSAFADTWILAGLVFGTGLLGVIIPHAILIGRKR